MKERNISVARNTRARPESIALVFVVLCSDVFFTGLVFGWAPMLLLLQEEKQYNELCLNGESHCNAQDSKLNIMYALASVAANMVALPVGLMLDYCGPKIAIGIAAILEISGLVLMALSDSVTWDMFVPAYIMLALGGCITMMASYPASFLIMQHQTAILAAISCGFDGSSIVFLLLYSLHSSFGFTRQQLFYYYAVFAVIIYSILIILWSMNEIFLKCTNCEEEEVDCTETQVLIHDSKKILQGQQEPNVTYQTITSTNDTTQYDYEMMKNSILPVALSELPLKQQIASFEFGFVLCFASFQVFRANLYIGTTNKLLENYGDSLYDFMYTKIFSFVLPLGFLFVPAIDYIVEHKGLPKSLLFTNCIGLAFNSISLIPNLPLQCLVFFIFTAFRAFLYAVISAFTAKIFGLKNLGTIVGLTFTCGSLFSLLEIPAVDMSNTYYDGDLTIVYSISIAICILLFVPTEYYRRRSQLNNARNSIVSRALLHNGYEHVEGGSTYHRSPCLPSPSYRTRKSSPTYKPRKSSQ